MLSSFEKQVQSFYRENQKHLEQSYPGLKLRRLLEEALQYIDQKKMMGEDYLKSLNLRRARHSLDEFFSELMEGRPLEYINKQVYFYKCVLRVDEQVLIPRSETELLVEKALDIIDSFPKDIERLRVVDIGTGSGAILHSLLSESSRPLEAWGIDLSSKALSVAQANAFNLRYRFSEKSIVHFKLMDRLSDFTEKTHLIVSNPPYIKRNSDQSLVHGQVHKYEPSIALYLDDEGYEEWFRLLFEQAQNSLYEGGWFLMEGHENHLSGLSKIISQGMFQEVQIFPDLAGRQRFLLARRSFG